jgi:hypothetical protein
MLDQLEVPSLAGASAEQEAADRATERLAQEPEHSPEQQIEDTLLPLPLARHLGTNSANMRWVSTAEEIPASVAE